MASKKIISYMLLHTKFGKNRLVYNALKKFSEIIEIFEVFGRYDLIVRIEVDSIDQMNSFIQNKVWLTEGINNAETLITNDLGTDESEPVEEFDDENDDFVEL